MSLTVLDGDDWYRHVSLRGRVVSIEPDEGLRDIDRLSQLYRSEPYRNRDHPRHSAWIAVESWHAPRSLIPDAERRSRATVTSSAPAAP